MEQHDDEQQGLAAAVPMPTAAITVIPDDVVVDVFRRVASPRALAACRCVCRAWRALIDDHRLLLPLSLAALLLCLNVDGEPPELFARPGADVTGYLMPCRTNIAIDDHCNGLILIHDDVLNPATGRVVRLPECPPSPLWEDPRCFSENRYLAFDPAESPHYQVFCIPMVLTHKTETAAYRAIAQCEWPPSPFVLSVFSSMTGRWEARSLVRQGGAAGTVDDMDVPLSDEHQHSACWRGALYVHCQNDFVLRISLSEHTTTYQVIKPPRELEDKECRGAGRLGRSEKGVYFASFDRESHLCVWILHDDSSSCGHMEWILRHRSAYGLALPSSPRSSWTLHNAVRSEDGNADAQEWDSDDDDGESTLHTETEDRIQERLVHFQILALHPYREIVFMFVEQHSRGVAYAYHLKSCRLEDLGNLFPKDGTSTPGYITWMENSFPYTPCWTGAP